MNGLNFGNLPLSAKALCTFVLLGFGVAYLAAFVQASTTIGLAPANIRESLAPDMPSMHLGHGDTHQERQIDLDQMSSQAKVWIRTPLLIQTTHTHLFGLNLVAGLVGLVFLFSSLRERIKVGILALLFVGILVDIGGMWLTRFVWPPFSIMVLIGGTMFALGYVLITFISLYELWIKKEQRA